MLTICPSCIKDKSEENMKHKLLLSYYDFGAINGCQQSERTRASNMRRTFMTCDILAINVRVELHDFSTIPGRDRFQARLWDDTKLTSICQTLLTNCRSNATGKIQGKISFDTMHAVSSLQEKTRTSLTCMDLVRPRAPHY